MGIWLHCEPVLRAHCRVFTVRVGDRRLAAVKSFRWLAPQKHAKHTAGSRQLLCGTNALHWVLDAKADFHSARSQQDQEERSSLSFVQRLTNCDVKTDVFQKPVASHCATDRLVFPDSLHSACSHQWSQDPLEAACDYIMLWKWNEGEEWIWLDGDGWRWKGGLFCYLLLLLSFFHPFLYTIGSFLSFFNPPPVLNLTLVMWFICIQSSLCSSHPFLFFYLPSVLSDYCGDGPVKASPIIVFEQHCSLALCSADTRLFLNLPPVLCLLCSDRICITHTILCYTGLASIGDLPRYISRWFFFFLNHQTETLEIHKWLWKGCFCDYQHWHYSNASPHGLIPS